MHCRRISALSSSRGLCGNFHLSVFSPPLLLPPVDCGNIDIPLCRIRRGETLPPSIVERFSTFWPAPPAPHGRGRPLTFAASFSTNCVCAAICGLGGGGRVAGATRGRADGTFSFVSNTEGGLRRPGSVWSRAGESRGDLRTFVSVELSYPSGLMEGALFRSFHL